MRFALALLAAVFAVPTLAAPPARVFGTLQTDPAHAAELAGIGARLATIEITWDRYEPQDGVFNAAYAAGVRARMKAFRAAGMQMVLDFGFQYAPAWVFDLPDSHYVNQYGDRYVPLSPGMGGANAVFNVAIRQRQAEYVRHAFQDFGTDFFAVRCGWGWFGELNYPPHKYRPQGADAERANCYWLFDPIAQGKKPGLPAGMKPCPVPGWIPGTPTPDHASARQFVDWQMASLQNYHGWQIATVRRFYKGNIAMLYPSWGVRPGRIEEALSDDLGGKTSIEINGEIQRGFDFARYIGGIKDRGVIVYGTWADATDQWDGAANPDGWSPIHYLASLAGANPLRLRVWGENTGGNSAADMARTFQQMRKYHLIGINWAFDTQLRDGQHASVADLAREIAEDAK